MHGQHHHRGITKYFRAKEVAGIKEDLWHVKNHVIKLTNNQKLLFATMIKHQEILANHSLLWVQNQHRWDDLYTPDPASILTKDQKHSSMVQEEVRIFSNTISPQRPRTPESFFKALVSAWVSDPNFVLMV